MTPVSVGDGFDVKEQIRQAVDIVDLIGSYVNLSRQGAGYKALCPFHDDQRPSLDVNPARQSWRCWVCDIGGDVFSFVMRREGVEFREALEMLAERAGVELKRGPRPQPGSAKDRATLLKAMTWAERQFHDCLLNDPAAEPARIYLDERGITERSIHRFHLGFAPNDWQWLLNRATKSEFSPDILQAVGLLRKNQSGGYYDFYRGRVMFSIRDTQGRPIAAGGRILPQFADEHNAKYFNSPETPLFNKSEQLYALDLARDAVKETKSLVVVEGYTDVVMAHQLGVENVVAVLGTALTTRHIHLLKRFTDCIYLVLDGDTAGQQRTNDMLDLFVAEDVDLRIVSLPDGADPCDLLIERGPDAFREQLDRAVDALEHRFRTSMHGLDPVKNPHQANQALEQILATMAKAPRISSDSARRLRVHQMLARLSRLFFVDEDQIRGRLDAIRRRETNRQRPQPAAAAPPPVRYRAADLKGWERELLEILIEEPQLREKVAEKIPLDQLETDVARRLYQEFLDFRPDSPFDFTALLTQIEDFDLKSILVALDKDVSVKSRRAQMSAPARLDDLTQHLAIREAERRRKLAGQVLEGGQYADPSEEVSALAEIFTLKAEAEKLARHREGESEPTDG